MTERRMHRLQPPIEVLVRAFQTIRKTDWPTRFSDLPCDGLRYRLVRLQAIRFMRNRRTEGDTAPRPTDLGPDPRPVGRSFHRPGLMHCGREHPHACLLDGKRLAAGERDDD